MEGPMTDRSTADREPDVPDSPELTDCPLCGQPLSLVTIHGPQEAVAKPCGCRMPPDPTFVRQ